MNIRILTDSGSDLPQNYHDKVTVLPMTITIGEESFRDNVDLSHKEFYEKLVECGELPHTSQINPHDYEEAIRNAADKNEEIIIIAISSKLSGTYQSACIAASECQAAVHIVDSENVAVGQKALVQLALDLMMAGKTATEIVDELNRAKKKLHVVALLDTLEYLKKGGRISASVAMVGGMLSIKPVVGVVDGEVAMLGKSRGSKNGNNLLIEKIKNAGGIDFSLPYFLGYTGLSNHLIEKYIEDSASVWAEYAGKPTYSTIGATIGTHVGPGAIAVAFFSK